MPTIKDFTNRPQKGFAIIETLLILGVAAIIGGTGYYVWHTKQQTDKLLDSAQDESSGNAASEGASLATGTVKVPFKDGENFTSPSGRYTLLPKSKWAKTFCAFEQNSDSLLINTTSATAPSCKSEGEGFDIVVHSASGDSTSDIANQYNTYSYLKGYISAQATIAGVKGTKYTVTLGDSGAGLPPPVGTQQIEYVFFYIGRTYSIKYDRWPSAADATADFESMVNNSFQVSQAGSIPGE